MVEVTGSTQDDLSQSVKKDATRSGTLLIANFQSSGRGRLDRTFSAPPSSALTLSFYLTPHLDRAEWSFLPLLTGLSAISSLKNLDAGLRVSLKWPNDLLVNGRKLGGILAEATSDGVVIGIGVNVAMAQDQLPTKDATSLLLEDFACLDRLVQCLPINQATPGNIDYPGRGLHCCDTGCTDNTAGLVIGRAMQGDVIGHLDQVIYAHCRHTFLLKHLGRNKRIERDNLHLEGLSTRGHDTTDVAIADHAERLVRKLGTHKL